MSPDRIAVAGNSFAGSRQSWAPSEDVADWTRCAALLDDAAALDPAGEHDARVRNARAAIAAATPPPASNEPGTSLKPPR